MLLQSYDFAHMHRDDGRRAPDGRRRPVGEHHGRAGAHPALDGRGGRPRAGARARLQAAALAVGREVREERGRRLGLARSRPGRRPYAFYQYWLNTDDRDVGTYLRWFTEFPRERIEGLEAEAARCARGAGRAARARASTSRPGRTGRRPPTRRSRTRPPGSRARPITDPGGAAVAVRVERRVHVRPGRPRERDGGRARRRRAVRLARRGAPDDRRRRRHGQRRARDATRDHVPEPIAGEWLDVRIGKRRREIGRRVG